MHVHDRWIVHLTLLVALLTLPASAYAAELIGTVRSSESGKALGFTSIQLENETGNRGLICGADGSFRATSMEPGTYQLTASYLGHQKLTIAVVLTDVAPTVLDLVLEVEAIELDRIDVRGDREAIDEELQTGFVDLSSEQLARVPAFGEADPIRALQLLPGVQAASDLSSGLYVRGGGPDQNLVLLDGVPIYNPTHAFGLFSSFHPDLIESVRLYKGAYPAKYGGRLGSVLDIRSLEGAQEPLAGRVGVSTIAARALLRGQWGKRTWAVGARRTYLDPVLAALRRSNSDVPSYWFGDVNAKLNWPTAHGGTEARVFFSRDALQLEASEDTGVDLTWGNFTGSATHRRLFGENAVATGSMFISRYRSDTELSFLSSPASFANRLVDISAGATLAWQAPPHHRFEMGMLASRYDFSFYQSFNQDEQLDYGAIAWDLALFAEDIWRVRPETTIRLGARARYLSDGDRLRLEPRLSFRQQLNERWAAKLGGGIYNQVLQLVSTEGFSGTDFYLPIDESTSPSRSWQIVAGLEWSPEPEWQATVEAYYTGLSNLVLLDNRVPADQSSAQAADVFITDGTGWASGVELFVQRRAGALTGWLGYGLGWTRRTFGELNGGRQFPPKYDRRHDASAVLQLNRGPWQYGASVVYGTGQAFTPGAARYSVRNPATGGTSEFGDLLAADRNSARLFPYHRLDLSVRRSFGMFGLDAWWNFQVFNVYSRRNDWFVTFDTAVPGATPDVVQQLPVIPSLGLEVQF